MEDETWDGGRKFIQKVSISLLPHFFMLNKSVFVRKFLPSFADGHIAMWHFCHRQNARISQRTRRQWLGHPHSVRRCANRRSGSLSCGAEDLDSTWLAATWRFLPCCLSQNPTRPTHVAPGAEVQIVPPGRCWTGGGRRSPNPSPTGARWREHRLPTPRLRAHSGRWIGWPTHQRRQSMPLRACASLGCSYAKFDERGFSGNDELGLRCEIRFLARKTSCGLVVVALFLHRQCTKRSL